MHPMADRLYMDVTGPLQHSRQPVPSYNTFGGQPKALVVKSTRYAVAVVLAHPLSARHVIPAPPHSRLHIADDAGSLGARQEETLGLGEQIMCVSVATPVPAGHGKIAALKTHRGRGSEVVRRRQLPILLHRNHGVIARMIVKVRNECVEGHPAK